MEIFSAGTSGTSAEGFFRRLKDAGVTSVVDTRLNTKSQLAAFAKSPDLKYFLRELVGIPYFHEPLLAPEDEALKAYRAKKLSWADYEERYVALLESRNASTRLELSGWGPRPLLLCSEPTPERCHRRLAANYLRARLPGVENISHL